MVAPLLTRLSPRARLASPFIRRGAREGLSFNQIRTSLTRAGVGITSAELSPILKRERELIIHGRNLRYLPFNAKPDPKKLPVSIRNMKRRYAYNVQVFGYSSETGMTMARHITISTNTLLTRAQAEISAESVILQMFDNYKMEIEETQLEFVQENALFRPFG